MKVYISRHLGWFLLPAIQFTPGGRLEVSRHYLAWSITIWWGNRGLCLIGPNDDTFQ